MENGAGRSTSGGGYGGGVTRARGGSGGALGLLGRRAGCGSLLIEAANLGARAWAQRRKKRRRRSRLRNRRRSGMTGGSHSWGPPVSGSRWERAARGRAGAGLRRGLGGPRCWAKAQVGEARVG
ncbi:uncharacterized protein LOC110432712 [Sorghum bicolor]|uniref:uncharacterized protein LOC110432712 n=1 Tax=Sorghum bicolor TaxID=4558 RepID=UPI000B42621E|nr:uncharacterized protein LOC110432712 [Sorghum bicolor]|eukprot:XP_021309173.1 uncharacterized protein LOC110432712 [Sorghum bicolor]